jgi:ankyrin repeat protein
MSTDDASLKALLRSAQRGDVEGVRAALNESNGSITVNSASATSGNTALHEASQREHIELVRELLALGADANARNSQGATPLHKAVSRPSERKEPHLSETVAALVRGGGDVGAVDRHGDSPLTKAIRQNRRDDISLLLDAMPPGAAVGDLLHVAALDSAAVEIIDALVKKFGTESLHMVDAEGRTPLLYSGLKRDGRDFAKLTALRANWAKLCDLGARLCDAKGFTFLRRSDLSSEFVSFLLDRSRLADEAAAAPAAVSADALSTVGVHAKSFAIWPLQRIAASDDLSATTAADADAILGALADASDPSNVTLLHALALEPEAVEAGSIVVRTLGKFRGDKLGPFALQLTRCANRRTVLHNAALSGAVDIVRELFAALREQSDGAATVAALAAVRNAAGETACDVAAINGRVDVWCALVAPFELPHAYPGDTKYLVQHTADGAPLMVRAALANSVDAVVLLLALGVDIGAQNEALDEYSDESGTALHAAARRNQTAPVLERLLAHASAASVVNKAATGLQQQTPLHIAVGQGAVDCVRLLVRHGADAEARDALERSATDLAMMGTDESVARALTENE